MATPRTASLLSSPSYSGVQRLQDHKSGGWLWRVYVTFPDRRVDRHFFDSTYGDEVTAQAMARAWRDALLVLRAESGLTGAALDRRLAAVQADFDARRPRWIFVRVQVLDLKGGPGQLRFLVSDRGQVLRRRESAVSFSRSQTFEVALGVVKERVRQRLDVFFGPAVTAGFMADHGDAFLPAYFDPVAGITLRVQLDHYCIGV